MTTIAGDEADDDPCRAETRLLQDKTLPSENWDDDFEFQTGSVPPAPDSGNNAMNAPMAPRHSHEQEESWDDAYEDDDTHSSPVKRAPKVVDDDVEDWDSSDNELEPHEDHHRDIRNHQGREFGMGGFEEEDKTVTARSASFRRTEIPPPLPLPIPPSQSALPFQAHTVLPSSTTSPTLSTFSIPLSSTTRDHASIYSQDPLMPNSSSSAPHLSIMRSYPHAAGSTPPRKGRRLRKKSRPPEADIFELEDREPDVPPAPVLPPAPVPQLASPPPTTPPRMQQLTLESPSRASQSSAPPTPSPSLLTRIGSFKRWARRSVGPDDPSLTGWRRGRASTDPSEIKSNQGINDASFRAGKSSMGSEGLEAADESLEIDARTVSPTPAPKGKPRRSRGDSASGQKSGWFFRAGGAPGAKRDEVTPTARTPEQSPTKRRAGLLLRRKSKGRMEDDDEEVGEGATPTPRVTKVKIVHAPNVEVGEFVGSHKQREPISPMKPQKQPRDGNKPPRPMSMLFPRHGSASVGRNAGMPLAVSVSTGAALSNSLDEEPEGKASGEKDGGMRGLMNGVRRLSLVGAGNAHKRTKSTSRDGAAEAAKSGVVGRSRSSTDQRPASKPDRSALNAPTAREGLGSGNGLLPPVELEPPTSSLFARRGSLPWADYSPDVMAVPESHQQPTSNFLSPQQPPPHSRPLFSASASSLVAGSGARSSRSGSPAKPTRSSTAPIAIPALPGADRPPRPMVAERHAAPISQSLDPYSVPPSSEAPSSPVPLSASLGRSAASPSHSAGLRRNSLGDLKMPTNTLSEHRAHLPPLGELKIPARISRAQQGLRRDMGMVKEFAGCVEQLKHLQVTYINLLSDLRSVYEASPVSPVPATTHVQFHRPSRPPSQTGIAKKTITTNPNPSVQSVHQTTSLNSPTRLHPPRSVSRTSHDVGREFQRLEHEYSIWWECAELLVELGGGSGEGTGTASNPNLTSHSTSSVNTSPEEPTKELGSREEQPVLLRPSNHVSSMSEPGSLFEQALPTILNGKGPPQASPPHLSQWRASTGRHDLSARQLRLLKDMLNTPDPASLAHAAGPYGYGAGYPQPHSHPYTATDAQPWAPWNPSTVTLPSEESSTGPHGQEAGAGGEGKVRGKEKKRRASKLGMLGLREILRSLKRNAVAEGRLNAGVELPPPGRNLESSASNSAEDDHYNRRHSPWHQHDEYHTCKQSTGPEVAVAIDRPPLRALPPKSPRRPSLASIFRIGGKNAKSAGASSKHRVADLNGIVPGATADERDLDQAVAGAEHQDWERMSHSDLDLVGVAVGSGVATLRGRKTTKTQASRSSTSINYPYLNGNVTTPKKTPATSQASLWDSSSSSATSPSRPSLGVAEDGGMTRARKSHTPVASRPTKERTSSWSQAVPARPPSHNGKAGVSGTVRSAPPADLSSMPDPKLALTPDNIKPLLEYAREVSTRLTECIGEVQALLGSNANPKLG